MSLLLDTREKNSSGKCSHSWVYAIYKDIVYLRRYNSYAVRNLQGCRLPKKVIEYKGYAVRNLQGCRLPRVDIDQEKRMIDHLEKQVQLLRDLNFIISGVETYEL